MKSNDDTDDWNRQVGAIWALSLRRQGLRSTGTVVEVGPGFSDKIARGLAALDFHGKVMLVEPNAAASTWVGARYRRWLPQAEVSVIDRALPEGGSLAGSSVDVLVANHFLDDFILNAALAPGVCVDIFAQMRPGASCSPLFIREWCTLLARPKRVAQLLVQVAEEFSRYVVELRPRLLLLNQYPSWRHDQQGLHGIHTQAIVLMQMLLTRLRAAGIEATELLDTNSLPALHWLIGMARYDCANTLEPPTYLRITEEH